MCFLPPLLDHYVLYDRHTINFRFIYIFQRGCCNVLSIFSLHGVCYFLCFVHFLLQGKSTALYNGAETNAKSCVVLFFCLLNKLNLLEFNPLFCSTFQPLLAQGSISGLCFHVWSYFMALFVTPFGQHLVWFWCLLSQNHHCWHPEPLVTLQI